MSRPDPIINYHSQIQRNQKWNFTMFSLDGLFFGLGISFAEYTTILAAFVALLTDSEILVGLIPTIVIIGWFFPQLFSAYLTEHKKLKKPSILKLFIGHRLPWLLMGLSTLIFAKTNPQIVLIAFFIFFAIASFFGGIILPVWMTFMAGGISKTLRGRLSGIRGLSGGLLGIGAGVIVAGILEKYTFPVNYSICFLLCFLFTSICFIFIVMVKEVEYPEVKEKVPLAAYIKNIPAMVRQNRNYMFFLVSQILLKTLLIGSAFYTVYAIKIFKAGGDDIAVFLILFVIGKSLGTLVLGYVGDYKGHVIALRLSSFAGILGLILACLATRTYHLFIVFVLQGIYFSGNIVSGINAVIEFCRPEERPTYIGLTNTAVAPLAGLMPVLAGILLQSKIIGYTTTFLVAGAIASIGLAVLLFRVTEPRE
jgi:MFS family permease